MSKDKHSPTPWRRCYTRILDADGLTVCVCERDSVHGMADDDTAKADAALIVEAVNDHAKMDEVAASLLRSRDAAIKDSDRLRDLVRDLADALDEAWGHQPPTTDAALLMQARKAVGEGNR